MVGLVKNGVSCPHAGILPKTAGTRRMLVTVQRDFVEGTVGGTKRQHMRSARGASLGVRGSCWLLR